MRKWLILFALVVFTTAYIIYFYDSPPQWAVIGAQVLISLSFMSLGYIVGEVTNKKDHSR